ncbi:hypothetical protein C8A03DRAFT_15745 [Achaetomium macrosporum]|uniref:Uncharacterized protein n=1 Tax=Achaetomium macrosporum TaxID=79813 RepID=A0AAN7CB48_9PEZI|nr:hypothetical protein C8A03DRAFT_15745 [Achaetomium macrosporum]
MTFAATPPVQMSTVMQSITVFGDLTGSTSCSQGTTVDLDMHDADWTEHSGDEIVFDTAYGHTGGDDNTPLRGGAVYRRANVAWLRKAVVGPPEEQRSDEEEDDEIDYEDLEEASSDDGSTSSDWDAYGSLPLIMNEYEEAAARLEGSYDWNEDQKKLHKLIYMRGLHPMLPSWWRLSFKMWGVTQPHLDDVFTPKHSKKRVAIHAYGNEVAATKALESLFYLSQTVTDFEEIGYESKISPTVVKGIRSYIRWALRDAGIDGSRTLPNMFVQAYPPDFDDDYESVDSNFTPSPASSKGSDDGSDALGKEQDEGDDPADVQRAQRFTRAVSRDLERRLLNMGQRWRDALRNRSGKGYIAQPPTLYAFAVIQHIVMLASHDSSESTNPVVVLEQVRLNDRGQWLWNALSIALPINMARDALNDMWDTGLIVGEHEDPSDPDL